MADVRRGARTRGKSDSIDSIAVARAALREGLDTLPAARLAGPELDLRLLVDHRERLVGQRVGLDNTLQWHLHDLWPELELPGSALMSRKWSLRIARRLARAEQTMRVRIARDELRRLRELTATINALESDITDLVADIAPQLLAEPGFGPLTAAKLIGEIAGAGRFASDAKLARAAWLRILAAMRWAVGVAMGAVVLLGCGEQASTDRGEQESAGRSDEQLLRTLATDYFDAVASGDTKRFCALLSTSTLTRVEAAIGAKGTRGCEMTASPSDLAGAGEEYGMPRVASVAITGDRARLELRTEVGGATVAHVMTAAHEADGWKVDEISAAEAPTGDKLVYRVPSKAMQPTFDVGDVVFVDPSAYERAEPRYGDIIVFNPPLHAESAKCADRRPPRAPCGRSARRISRLKFIKRVVGLPGDELAIRGGRVVRNGSPDAFHIRPCGQGSAGCDFEQSVRVPAKQYYVLGDNRGASNDSRFWGPIRRSAILGRVAEE